MSETPRVVITRLATGVPGLDEVFGGGLPEYSSTIISGAPGTSKTTLAHQILFALASTERLALYFSVFGDLELKMLRYQQQMDYFAPSRVGDTIRFVSLSDTVLTQDPNSVLAEITRRLEETRSALVVLDSSLNIAQLAAVRQTGTLDIQTFLRRLALRLTSWQTTPLLLGTYREEELHSNPVFTVADGIIWLSQITDHNMVVHKMQVMKPHEQDLTPGLAGLCTSRSASASRSRWVRRPLPRRCCGRPIWRCTRPNGPGAVTPSTAALMSGTARPYNC